jgi:hypothetical protein
MWWSLQLFLSLSLSLSINQSINLSLSLCSFYPSSLSLFSFFLLAHALIAQTIEEHDSPVLESLVDITLDYFIEPEHGYRLHFFFAPNNYFSETVCVSVPQHCRLRVCIVMFFMA